MAWHLATRRSYNGLPGLKVRVKGSGFRVSGLKQDSLLQLEAAFQQARKPAVAMS